MTEKIHSAWEQVTLSPQADERIRRALAAAEQEQKVIPLRKGLRRTTRAVLIAAAIICLLSVTALGVTMGRIVFREEKGAENYLKLGFKPTTDDPIQMGMWMLDVPEGFEESGSYYRDGDAMISYDNADGESITLCYQAADLGHGEVMIPESDILEKRDVTVNGTPGRMYVLANRTELIWTDDEKGVGFTLSCSDDSLDILALAETVRQVDEKPQLDENTLEAIAEFGDWRPTALPEGYSEYVSNGSPSKYGGEGGYGYVYRTYVNDAGYTIQLEYEFWRGVISYENQVYVFRNYRQNEYTVTDLTVQGLPAGLVETLDGSPALLTWVREGGDLVFKMRAENLTSEELLAVAESVALAP